MSSKKTRRLERYYENIPYGSKSIASEVHGPKNQNTINETIKTLVQMYDVAVQDNQIELAGSFKNGIYKISKQLEILKGYKEEHAMDLKTRSNWTDHNWDDEFFIEKGDIDFDKNMDLILGAYNQTTDIYEYKKLEDVTKDWESIGDWMQTLMRAKQDLIKERNSLKKEPSFNIDFFVNNLIKENWRSMISDPDPTLDPNGVSNGFRLQQILLEAADTNGNIPVDYNIDKNSFDPTHDTRLFKIISDELKRTFNPNYQAVDEQIEADQLMTRINN